MVTDWKVARQGSVGHRAWRTSDGEKLTVTHQTYRQFRIQTLIPLKLKGRNFCSLQKTEKTSYCGERSLVCVGVVYIMHHIRISAKSKVASSAADSHLLFCYK